MSSNRPLWTGTLAIGDLHVPARLLGAAAPLSKVAFNQAHRCKPGVFTRIKQQRVCPSCHRSLTAKDISRVFEHAPRQYLEITDADLARCEATPSDVLQIVGVLDAPLNPLFVDTTAFLLSSSPSGYEPFNTVRKALGDRTAVGELVLHKRAQRVMLHGAAGGFVVFLLRTVEEVRAVEVEQETAAMAMRTVSSSRTNVQRMRELLVEQPFEYEELTDTHSAAVRQLLIAKIEGESKASLTRTLQPRARGQRKTT